MDGSCDGVWMVDGLSLWQEYRLVNSSRDDLKRLWKQRWTRVEGEALLHITEQCVHEEPRSDVVQA